MRRITVRPGLAIAFASAWILAVGCATEPEQSFNDNFNQNLPAAPRYSVEDLNGHVFKIVMHQGAPMQDDPARITYLKQAVNVVAEDEAHRRGWSNWNVSYIQERDQGWMHILVAEVRRKPALNVTPVEPVTVFPTSPPPPPPPPPGQ